MKKVKNIRKSVMVACAAVVVLIAGISVYAATGGTSSSITEQEAKTIALAEVDGADESHITKAVKDKDDGRTEYDIEIIYEGYEYDFEISAEDGAILDMSREKAYHVSHDTRNSDVTSDVNLNQDQQSASGSQGNKSATAASLDQSSSHNCDADIGIHKAEQIALKQVSGASKSNIVKSKQDYDDGIKEYEVEIRYNEYEYEFEIDAANGNIISSDRDRLDTDDYYD